MRLSRPSVCLGQLLARPSSLAFSAMPTPSDGWEPQTGALGDWAYDNGGALHFDINAQCVWFAESQRAIPRAHRGE